MSWEIFEKAASRYESWYTTPAGQRADHAERALLDSFLKAFPSVKSVLEVGCGTGHFSEWLATQGLRVCGLDRSPAMLSECHQRFPQLPVILGDAHHLPVTDGGVDIVVFVTTVEFLDDPQHALREAVRVARHGVIVIALNRWSLGGLSRRWGTQARGTLLAQARDCSLLSLQSLATQAAGQRLQEVQWLSTLFPSMLWNWQGHIPLGDVIGVSMKLAAAKEHSRE